MGIYLNCKKPYSLYASERIKPYFVDKSRMLSELFPFVSAGKSYVCITRPRRFGKTVAANMIGAYFGRGKDSRELFSGLEIGTMDGFEEHVNQYNVIYITLNEVPDDCHSYSQYIARIKKILTEDLAEAFPECQSEDGTPLWDVLNKSGMMLP